jgi:CII-binding regulator of phage lambda lysogenization HflD
MYERKLTKRSNSTQELRRLKERIVCLENSLSSMQESSPRQEQLDRLEIYMLDLEKRLLAASEAMRVVEGAETMKCHGIKLETSGLSN